MSRCVSRYFWSFILLSELSFWQMMKTEERTRRYLNFSRTKLRKVCEERWGKASSKLSLGMKISHKTLSPQVLTSMAPNEWANMASSRIALNSSADLWKKDRESWNTILAHQINVLFHHQFLYVFWISISWIPLWFSTYMPYIFYVSIHSFIDSAQTCSLSNLIESSKHSFCCHGERERQERVTCLELTFLLWCFQKLHILKPLQKWQKTLQKWQF